MTCDSVKLSGSSYATKCCYNNRDTRKNYYELSDVDDFYDSVQRQAQSVACFVWKTDLSNNQDGTFSLGTTTQTLAQKRELRDGVPFGENEAFRDESVLGDSTAFLVGDHHVLTAAHCVCHSNSSCLDKNRLHNIRLVFGFYLTQANQPNFLLQEKDIYQVKKVIAHTGNQSDWALVKLDRKVENREPLKLDFETQMSVKREVYMLGYPSGLPLKFVERAKVKAEKTTYFEANLDAFHGNSGSPVFDKKNGNVSGILIEGHRDYKVDENYQNTGVRRGQVHQVTSKEISTSGYEKVQRVTTLHFVKNYFLAHEGDLAAQLYIGTVYYEGIFGVKKNLKKSIKWLQISAGCGYEPSQKKLEYVEQMEAKASLYYGPNATADLDCQHTIAFFKAGAVAILTAPLLGLPGMWLAESYGNEIYNTKRFEMLALDDTRFQIFVYLSNDKIEKAEAEFEKHEHFYANLFKVSLFHHQLMNCHTEDRREKYVNFFRLKGMDI